MASPVKTRITSRRKTESGHYQDVPEVDARRLSFHTVEMVSTAEMPFSFAVVVRGH